MPRFITTLRFACLAVAVGILAAPARSDQPSVDRAKAIAEIEAKLKALSADLDKLKAEASTPATSSAALPADWVKGFTWRSIGPGTMGGRITAISVFEADPTTYWIATASGGLLKTENNGITFAHQFDRETTVSIGDVAVAPSDKNVVWVGTGEANPRNSVSYGDGAYKSTDGGKSWKNMGLKGSFQIGRVAIHPKDPNTVYVGALGRLYGPNPERGVFKTTDGGATWTKILFFDDVTGCIDLRMHPSDPNVLIAALWERRRDGFDSYVGEKVPDGIDGYDPAVKFGKYGGIYRTADAGKTWDKVTKGLPTVKTGRIGLDWNHKDANVVVAIIDSEKVGTGAPAIPVPYMGLQGEDVEGVAKLSSVTDGTPAAKAGLKVDDVILEADGKKIETYQAFADAIKKHKIGEQMKIKVKRAEPLMQVYDLVATLEKRPEQPVVAPVRLGLGFQMAPAEGGIAVGGIEADSINAKAGLQVGDIIATIASKDATDFRELQTLLNTDRKVGDKIKVTIKRGDATKELELTLQAATGGPGGGGGGNRTNPTNPNRPYSAWYGGQRENVMKQQGDKGFETGGVYKSTDAGATWNRVNSINPRPMYFSTVRVDPSDDMKLYVLGVNLAASTNGGATFAEYGNRGVHPDHHALWINPKDGRHMLIGTDGGFYVTYDRMATWEHLALAGLGQFYHVAVDSKKPYNVYGGLQDNGTWGGPSRTLRGSGAVNEDWIMVGQGDGFMCRVDADDPDVVYGTSQDGNVYRRNLRTGDGGSVRPRPQNGQPAPRFNWNTPYILSSHNPKIVYVGGEKVFRSVKQGADARAISPEITKSKRGTASALAESPKNPDVLWAGSDDGALFVTRDGGAKWTDVYEKLGAPVGRWVSTIETSRTVEGRAYVCLDAHRSDDDKPYLYVTENFGETWKNITSDLPAFGSTRCLREDPINPNLLLCGTEFGVFASADRGGAWTKINGNLPTVAIHELAIHPTAGEVVAATHGRSLWIMDITALRQIKTEVVNAPAHLFAPATAMRWRTEPARGSAYGSGAKKFFGTNPPSGVELYYSIAGKPEKATLQILDYAGNPMTTITVKREPGLHKATWNLSRPSLRTAMAVSGGTALPEEAARRPGGFFGQPVPPGVYKVVLTVDGKEQVQPLKVEYDPAGPASGVTFVPNREKEREDD